MPSTTCIDCKRLIPIGSTRCGECGKTKMKARDANRPSSTERGYDAEYLAARKVKLARQPYCSVCGSTKNLEVDHIRPLAKDGTNEIENLDVLCRYHNRSKGDR